MGSPDGYGQSAEWFAASLKRHSFRGQYVKNRRCQAPRDSQLAEEYPARPCHEEDAFAGRLPIRRVALLCGDIEAKVERRLLPEGVPVQNEVVKVPHHGSNSPSLEEFIRRVGPKVAVVSCGQRDPYGHPAPPVIGRYERLDVRLFRTDRDGAVIVRFPPTRLIVKTTL